MVFLDEKSHLQVTSTSFLEISISTLIKYELLISLSPLETQIFISTLELEIRISKGLAPFMTSVKL